ncbi:hypothetical protein A1O3_07019 [Capronia epimyces CBS 606.96]|uniref:AAA+ ATPase domain-containing protein n=1 Tax=Capronia epimyces CBS 606.96 TaxID=1182542 RepID=W9XTR3_9EURO|nr:uncharacterized protein A1O3_07019 [Capronia epimyces CBS 606.96]EXJ80735.1 hypothetical protein A1O3_07019 [Capronia epimyces CBS 606.96]
MSTFIVRPSNTDRDPFRIKLTAVSMLSLKLKSGDTCELQGTESPAHGKKKLAIAWEASGAGMKDSIVQTSKLLQEVYGFRLGDKITIARSSQALQDSALISLEHVGSPLDEEATSFWESYAKLAIPGIDECLVESQRLRFKLGLEVTEFVVGNVGVQQALIARVTKNTKFRISSADEPTSSVEIDFRPDHLGGLQEEIRQVRDIVARICRPIVKTHFRLYRPIQGVLLYGAKGTGKTAFISALAESGWPMLINWKPGTQLQLSNEARLVTIGARYLSRSSNGTSAVLDELDQLFDQVRGSPTLVISEVRHPNDVDQTLRAEGRFAAEIELPIPSAHQRKEILLALRGNDGVPQDELLGEMADRTHGYVGADLYALVRRTLELASDRAQPSDNQTINGETPIEKRERRLSLSTPTQNTRPLNVMSADLDEALHQIRPSALQEIFLETPNVHWSDIGGQHEIKRQLHNAVERPLKFAERMKRLGLQPKKGVLLYGPPGCSKTLLVRALATEAGLNFLAVKGAELISMYVGESERATREVFRKARAASPSIIFFDEIDAIASRGRSGSDLNVLTTLLNEMDGFEELRNVLVVAATNKPQNIDPALMRPGRFDNVVYIGPPDFEARKEIFQKRLAKIGYEHRVGLNEDIEEFARSTEGFSGAEIVAICQTAGEYAFDGDRDIIVSDDMTKAIERTPKSITREMLFEFESWNDARMR